MGGSCDTASCNTEISIDTTGSISDPDGDDLGGEFLCVHDPVGTQNPFTPTDFTFADPWDNGALNGAPDFVIEVTPNDPCAPKCYAMAYNIPDKGFPDVDSGNQDFVVCYNDPPTLTALTGSTAPNGAVTINGSFILTNTAAASPDHCWVRICELNPGPNVLCNTTEFEFTIAGCTMDAEMRLVFARNASSTITAPIRTILCADKTAFAQHGAGFLVVPFLNVR